MAVANIIFQALPDHVFLHAAILISAPDILVQLPPVEARVTAVGTESLSALPKYIAVIADTVHPIIAVLDVIHTAHAHIAIPHAIHAAQSDK